MLVRVRMVFENTFLLLSVFEIDLKQQAVTQAI